jgi:hypothetical protein
LSPVPPPIGARLTQWFTLDAQQRVAADVSELWSRATSIEEILRTVE